jgi:hypothetical protein
VLFACQLAPFAQSVDLLYDTSNDRQRTVMALAERMTDPVTDRVYAASGLVPTRDGIGYYWFLHSLNIAHFYDGSYPTVRSMLRDKPAAVFIPSYRTDWLHSTDRRFIAEHYVPLADDFWVLGKLLFSGSGEIDCLQAGRYSVMHGQGDLEIDGVVANEPIQTLTAGKHRIAIASQVPTLIRWLGPTLKVVPVLTQSSHSLLFADPF